MEVIKEIDHIDVDATTSEGRHVLIRFTDIKDPIMERVDDEKEYRNRYDCVVGVDIKQKYESITFNSAVTEIYYLED